MVIAIEHGPVGPDGEDVVERAEEWVALETFARGKEPPHVLDWQPPPRGRRRDADADADGDTVAGAGPADGHAGAGVAVATALRSPH